MDRDALIQLTVSSDAMEATASFVPHDGSGRPLEMEYFHSLLESYNVIHGVLLEEVAETIFEVNTSHRAKEGVVVARGTPPVAARPPFYRVISPEKLQSPVHESDASSAGAVDYKRMSRLPVVRRGQLIARQIAEREGVAGTNVRGEEIPAGTVPVETLVPGKNTLVQNNAVFAARGGQLQIRDGEFLVEDHLEITGDVGFKTGSIEFPGDVVLKGDVQDGFHIWAGGAITAHGSVAVSQIYCRKDISCKGGLVGRAPAVLRVGGRVQAKFVENCQVDSKASIFFKQYVYQSQVNTLDRVAMGNRGRIVGGIVTATQGIRCYIAGNKAHAVTVLRVGMDFITERKLDLCRSKLESVGGRIMNLSRALPANPTDHQVDIMQHLEWMRSQLATQMGDLSGSLDADEEAEVVVDGDVFPGVQVQICRATTIVDKPLSKVRFRLDKHSGHIVTVSLNEGQ